MADLTEFYPAAVQASPNGAGRPASPAAAASGSPTAAIGGAPAVWVLILAGLSLALMHKA